MTMNPAIENLVEKYFHVNKLEEVDESVVEQLAGKYPYYAPLQYLLARKYRQMDALLYRLQVTKTAVFFSNPHWLNDLLQNDQDSNRDESLISPIDEQPGEIENEPVIQEPELPLPVPDNEKFLNGQAWNTGESEEKAGEADAVETEPEASISEPPSDTDAAPEELQVTDAEDIPMFREASGDSDTVVPEPGKEEDDQSLAVKTVLPLEPELEEPSVLPSLISEKMLPVIPVEPLFTVDYFASQGIRWNNEEGSDKLSKKLRSFTEWLKTMKRLHPEKMEEEMDKGRDGAIQNIAEHSNELDEVVTETMAEVFARQGLAAKAVEVYQKLSLLNPGKRAYFAARISKLNQT